MELYQHDFSELDGTDLDEYGQYGYYDLDCFWINPAWCAYVIKVDDKWAGFALTNDDVQVAGNSRAIVEFFVVRKFRKQGVGRAAALALMTKSPAKWEIRVMQENIAAHDFWERLVTTTWHAAHRKSVVENDEWHGPIFSVDTHRDAAS